MASHRTFRILLLGVALAAALTAAAPAAFPQPPQSRAEALAALKDADMRSRAEAVLWIANHGGTADAGLLQDRLRDESDVVREFAERGLWLLWSRSGDEKIDAVMARGVEEMRLGAYQAAIATFSDVIRQRPDFAEGWNKRATVYYLAGEYRKSIADCDEVLKRNPAHFGALSGLGEIYVALDEPERALGWFRKALEANPNLAGVALRIELLERILEERRKRTT